MNLIGLSSFDREWQIWKTPKYDVPIGSGYFLSPSYSIIDMAGVVVINSDSPVFENRNIAISIMVLLQGRIDA